MDGISDEGKSIMSWKSQHFCALVHLRAEDLVTPNELWAARYRNEAHIADLMSSFRRLGGISRGVAAVVVSNVLYREMISWTQQGRDPASFPFTLNDFKTHGQGLQTFMGDHTRVAAKRLAAKFSRTRLWKSFNVEVFVAPETQLTFRHLRMIGNVDNTAAGLQLKQDFPAVVQQMHEHYVALCDAYPPGRERDNAVQTMRKDKQYSLAIPLPSVNQIFGIARRTGRVWDLVNTILKGQCEPFNNKRQPPPKSAHPFVKMGSLDDDVVERILIGAVQGTYRINDIKVQCGLAKARVKVKKCIVDHVCAVYGSANQSFEDFDDVITEYPAIGEDGFLAPWVKFASDAKDSEDMPSGFYAAVNKHVDAARTAQV